MRLSAQNIDKQQGGFASMAAQQPYMAIHTADRDEPESGAGTRSKAHMWQPTSGASEQKLSRMHVSGREEPSDSFFTFQHNISDQPAAEKSNNVMAGATPRARNKRTPLQHRQRSGEMRTQGERQISDFPINPLADESVKNNAGAWMMTEERENTPPDTTKAAETAQQSLTSQRPSLQLSTELHAYERQRAATEHSGPQSARLQRYRGTTHLADAEMAPEELTDVLERLIQRVQEKRREVSALPSLTSPSATRFDIAERPAPRRSPSSTSATTEDTVQLSESDAEPAEPSVVQEVVAVESHVVQEAADDEVYSPRRRAVTVGPSVSERRAKLAARRLSGDCGGARAYATSVSEVRRKIEKVRARRAAQLALEAEQAAAEPVVPISPLASPSASSAEYSGRQPVVSGQPRADGFFESREARAAFQEIAMPVKDVEWEKRVYYYHAAQENEDFRRISEHVEILDCRAECLDDLLGPGAQVPEASSGHVADSEVDAVAEWLDEDDVSDRSDAMSFDWSRDGFGYMEFRRLSRASLGAMSTVGSPRRTEGGVAFAEPAVRPDTVSVEPQRRRPVRAAVAEMPRRRPLVLADLGLPPINESDAEEARRSANGQSAGDRALARARLLALRRENATLQDDLRRAQNAVRAMRKLYAANLAVQPTAA
ncbi:hypothetical protein LPJ73_003953 [Coemansia sp. RSA 2703]|nr:hypothetical protein LPJ73_003953 [Coemansia sp. RSA 2703]